MEADTVGHDVGADDQAIKLSSFIADTCADIGTEIT